MENRKLIQVNQELLPSHQRIGRDFFIKHTSVYELFKSQANAYPQKCFIIFPEYNVRFSYEELDSKITEQALYLRQKRIVKGDRIGLVLPTSPDFIVLYFAAFREGITVVPINPDLSPPEIDYIVADAQVKAVFYNEPLSKKISDVRKNTGLSKVAFINTSDISITDPKEKAELPAVHYTDEALIIYTSGTTGKPKGAVLSHLNLLADSQVISEWFQFTPDTRALCILPLFHNNGQVITLLAPLSAGGSTVMVPPKTSLRLFWSITKEYNVNWTSVMPSILAIILSLKLKRKDSSMAGIICGGQVLNAEVRTQFENTFQVPIFEGYGLTETTSFACFNKFPKNKRKFGSVGRALPSNDVGIFDENDKEVAPGKEGEICIRGLNVMTKYFGLDEVNKKVLRGGWFHSGDYGYIDADGYICFKTRKDYLIKKGGENIYPSEIENVLFGHRAVDECAVIGVPNELLGQDIVAFVKLNSKCTEDILLEYLTNKLAHYKYPKRIIIIDELADLDDIPKGPTKKVLYKVLSEYYDRRLKTSI
ncbi:hypothetical protein A3G53_00785 [Candidatus Nomurabacteria bacterium RIFCSPLOWO2_12_FULL_44_11]|uniref:AMP-dependent synthetase/ligase domain-containing protein n=2 Tax=Parcubacteria group TaxID=1794811 RepID=A0A1F6Y7P6_9BACT|nr:MAG: hypothetical protein A3F27_02230 [Candidatus Kaiserbacteria bacterium RIFCSPHIGHO2_12_FULL_53_13]OGG74695.1 MAG: hypothetical protein A3A37_02420 [Candidatus Kaiserbacteria bacterium RIFCSPLOWO2_01_FULL_52_36]OGJ02362.1 MAG: hypothetical protein A3G53_00785 [Candidatus Nomurabacteria bacterium RIFCSPLOWO2_12_FULL_44_11]